MKNGADATNKQETPQLFDLLEQVNSGVYSSLRELLNQRRISYFQLNAAETKKVSLEHLGEALTSTPVRTLELSGTRLTTKQACNLGSSLRAVTTLGLARNAIGDQSLTEVLQNNQSITFLNLESNQITAKGAAIIAKILPKMPALLTLWMPNNPLGDKGAAHLANALKHKTQFTCLGLSNTQISDEGATSIAEALMVCKSIKVLALNSNNIGPQGAKTLFKALIDSEVEELSISNNPIGDEGIAELTKVISKTKLKRVYLAATRITDTGAALLFEALPGSSVEILCMQNNKLTEQSLLYLAYMLKAIQHLQEINLDGNYIRNIVHLAQGLKGCPLNILHLGNNPIQDIQRLIDVVPHSNLLEVRGIDNRALRHVLTVNRDRLNRQHHINKLADRLVDVKHEIAAHAKRYGL